MAAFTRFLFIIYLLGLVQKAMIAGQCNGPRQLPIWGKMLKGHIYDKRSTRSGYAECLHVCRNEDICQSFNFIISEGACELNYCPREACPSEDFVSNPDRYYVKVRDVSRGFLHASTILGNKGSYLVQLVSYLDPVVQSSVRRKFVRCWHAKTDGWAASTFHNNCDGKDLTVTIIQVGSYIFGGYSDLSWYSSSCGYANSSKAFIFSLYNKNSNGQSRYNPVKREVKPSRYGSAVYRCASYGPTFGDGYDIHISDNAASNQNSYTSCGNTYPLPPGYSNSGSQCTFYAGSNQYHFTPTDVEVFYETTS